MAATPLHPAARFRPAAFTAVAALLLLAAPAARAQTWNEVGDAGSSIATAQGTIGAGPLTTINGSLSGPDDVDVYCVVVGPTPAAVGLPVVSMQCVVSMGPDVRVFDANGFGVSMNGLCAGGVKPITTTTFSPGSPGVYYVAVSYFGVEPQSASGAIWTPGPAAERSPDGPGAAGSLTGWAGTGNVQPNNPYQLVLGYAGYCDAATPSRTRTWGTLKIRYGS